MKDLKVTKEGGLRGTELLNELSTATGLPNEMIGEELSRLISVAGKSTDSVTLDELREMLAMYVQDVLLDAKSAFEGDARSEVEAAAAAVSIAQAESSSSTASFAMFSTLGSSATDFIGEG